MSSLHFNLTSSTSLKEDFATKIDKKFGGKKDVSIQSLLLFCSLNDCSDLYIKVSAKPYILRFGKLYRVECFNTSMPIWNKWAQSNFGINAKLNERYVHRKMLDFSYKLQYTPPNKTMVTYHYRVSVGYSTKKSTATFRMIALEPPTFRKNKFSESLIKILRYSANKSNHITIMAGPTGSGKSTTFAASINEFTKNDGPLTNKIIISLEDPIENILSDTANTHIIQKELGEDFLTFNTGVEQSLREHPNFINVGETRDRDTINAIVEASRTGHAVWTTFHSSDVADTISRLYAHLSGNDGRALMYDLITNMNLILCQKLLPVPNGYQLQTQYMVFTLDIIKYLNDCIAQNLNIPPIINSMMERQDLMDKNIVQNWK